MEARSSRRIRITEAVPPSILTPSNCMGAGEQLEENPFWEDLKVDLLRRT